MKSQKQKEKFQLTIIVLVFEVSLQGNKGQLICFASKGDRGYPDVPKLNQNWYLIKMQGRD